MYARVRAAWARRKAKRALHSSGWGDAALRNARSDARAIDSNPVGTTGGLEWTSWSERDKH